MERKIINATLSVSGQITPEDVTQLHNEGVKTIICNRPDHEDPAQVTADAIQQTAGELGMQFHFMPVISGQISQVEGEAFAQLLEQSPSPIHAYCRSGTRCTILWALQALLKGEDKQSVLTQAAQAGYDLSKNFA